MQNGIMWGPLLIFIVVVGAYMLIDHMRSRPARTSSRSDFRRMESPAARARRRAAVRNAMGQQGGGLVR